MPHHFPRLALPFCSLSAYRFAWFVFVGASFVASCGSVQREGDDRTAFSADVRVRKELKGEPDHQGPHLEAGWSLADGDADGIDFAIHDATVGFGYDWNIGTEGWAGFVGGLAWQHLDLDVEGTDFDGEDSFGPYVALQGGWRVTTWLEPFARADAGFYLPDIGSTIGIELGARIHVVEPAAMFVGWRYAHYEINDFDSLDVDEVDLDVSGLIVGLEFAF